jgi:hypothetical protein
VREELYRGFWWRNLKEIDHLEDPCVDGRIILKRILKRLNWDMSLIGLAQHRDKWRELANAVMNIRVP